jgi:hypothetical protein
MHAWDKLYGPGIRDALRDAMRSARVPKWEARDDAPGTVADLIRCYREKGRIIVSALNSDETVWRDPQGNFAFRAWHDWAHIRSGFGFTAAEEISLGYWQCGHARVDGTLASIVLEEISDQAEYYQRTGRFLDGAQLDFALTAVRARESRRIPYALVSR